MAENAESLPLPTRDVDRIRRSPYLAHAVPTSGYIWDLRAQRLQPVVVDPRARVATSPSAGRTRPSAGVPSGGIWSRPPDKGSRPSKGAGS